jgi:hypothetical protein
MLSIFTVFWRDFVGIYFDSLMIFRLCFSGLMILALWLILFSGKR